MTRINLIIIMQFFFAFAMVALTLPIVSQNFEGTEVSIAVARVMGLLCITLGATGIYVQRNFKESLWKRAISASLFMLPFFWFLSI